MGKGESGPCRSAGESGRHSARTPHPWTTPSRRLPCWRAFVLLLAPAVAPRAENRENFCKSLHRARRKVWLTAAAAAASRRRPRCGLQDRLITSPSSRLLSSRILRTASTSAVACGQDTAEGQRFTRPHPASRQLSVRARGQNQCSASGRLAGSSGTRSAGGTAIHKHSKHGNIAICTASLRISASTPHGPR